MTVEVDFADEQWWRADRYEIVNGVIRPAKGAAVEPYSLWQEGRSSGSAPSGPYVELLELAAHLKVTPALFWAALGADERRSGSLFRVDADGEKAVLEWCSQHGLLGLLPHQALAITLPARWEKPPGSMADVPTVTRYVRTGAGWTTAQQRPFEDPAAARFRDENRLEGEYQFDGGLVGEEDLPSSLDRPGVLLRNLHGDVNSGTLAAELAPYFPAAGTDAAETFSYPRPLSERFWHEYGEPLDMFLIGALAFAFAVDLTTDNERESPNLWPLQSLITPVMPTVRATAKGEIEQRWNCGSLLSALAMMTVLDLSAGTRVARCAACTRYFSSRSPLALYCSRTCKLRAQKRAYRAGLRTRRDQTREDGK